MSTRYEVAVEDGAGGRWLLGYTARQTRIGLLAVARQHSDELLARFEVTDQPPTFTQPVPRQWRLGLGGCAVLFTGRTQLEAGVAPLPSL